MVTMVWLMARSLMALMIFCSLTMAHISLHFHRNNAIVQQILALLLVAADASKHDVHMTQHHAPSPPLEIVESELQQILVNLFINAFQAMETGGSLTVSTGPEERDGQAGVCISVADTGEGMLPERLEQIFDPFFTTKRAEGTGLGLSISQALAGKAGGFLRAESKIGEGTTFFLWCPAAVNLS